MGDKGALVVPRNHSNLHTPFQTCLSCGPKKCSGYLIKNLKPDSQFPCSTNQKALSAAENALLVSPFNPNAFWQNLLSNECIPCGAETELAEKVVDHAINVISSNVEAYDEDGRCNLKCANCNCRMLFNELLHVKAELKTTKETLGVTARELDETMQELHWTNCALED